MRVGYRHALIMPLLLFVCALGMLLAVGALPAAYAAQSSGSSIYASTDRGRTMVIIGASYAKDWNIDLIDGQRVMNAGVGGEQTHQMFERFERDVVRQRPSSVLIWGFINDIFRTSREQILQRRTVTQSNIDKMVQQARAAGIQPWLATEVTITSPDGLLNGLRQRIGRWQGKTSYQDYINQHVRAMNDWVRQYGQARGIPVLDFERVLADANGERQRRYAAEDGSHLSDAAYAALTEYSRTFTASRNPERSRNHR